MLIFTERLPASRKITFSFTLSLTAEERSRSRYRYQHSEGEALYLRLPRGTILQDGDLLRSPDQEVVIRIAAKPEPVITVTSATPVNLMRAAYHLGNRHVLLEIAPNYLRLSPDPVLQAMLEQLGVDSQEEIVAFKPEIGAYGHSHH